MAGGSLSTRGGSDQILRLSFVVEGLEKTEEEFKATRRGIDRSLRDVMQRVGETEVLPGIRSDFPGRKFADSLFVKRDRLGVFIGSRMRGPLNRALGWLDFGGKRPRDGSYRAGPHTIVRNLDQHRDELDAKIERALLDEFRRHGFEIEYV